MLERDEYPPGVPCWVDTDQPDPQAGVEFYAGLFGWEFEGRMPADAPVPYSVAKLRGRDVAGVGGRPENAPPTPVAWNTYVAVESADASSAKAKDAGGEIVIDPFDVLDAGRMAVLADPEGAVFCVWQAMQSSGAVLVNEPGTWNFSALNTRDPDGARAFYGTVFGWETETVEGGGMEFTFWRLPGYGDFLETLDPEVRNRQRDSGAPEGFDDAVAWFQPMTGDRFGDDVPPHWSITFAVDDADAAAGKVSELGGKVLAGPLDAGPTRIAVVSDPAGATFTVSRYYPDAL
ncbi:MAG: VOC family protein [Solirubrobacterales bacterium]